MTDLLSIGASSIRAYSRALGTVSDNIANAQTPGYARRAVRLEEAPTGSNSPLYRAGVQPGGVLVDGVVRAVDAWLVDDARISGSDAGGLCGGDFAARFALCRVVTGPVG